MALWLEQCAFASKQLIKITEAPEHVKPGETPQSLTVYAYDELVDACRPGDRVEVTGMSPFPAAPPAAAACVCVFLVGLLRRMLLLLLL